MYELPAIALVGRLYGSSKERHHLGSQLALSAPSGKRCQHHAILCSPALFSAAATTRQISPSGDDLPSVVFVSKSRICRSAMPLFNASSIMLTMNKVLIAEGISPDLSRG